MPAGAPADQDPMAVAGSRRRLALLVVAVAAVVGIGATGLVGAFRDEASTARGRDSAIGRRLRAAFVVRVEDQPLAEATATLRLTNSSDRPAWYQGNECAGPGHPAIGPEGRHPESASILEEGPIRDRLIAAGESTRTVSLGRSDGEFCELGEGVVRVEPHETVSWEYRSVDAPVDRSSALVAVAVVPEVDRGGRSVGRLRLAVPFPELPDARGLAVDPAVDAFLADPTVADLVSTTGENGVLTAVSREGDVWRMSLGTGAGDLSGEVHPDFTVTDVHIVAPP
jgi:hypothetical protein